MNCPYCDSLMFSPISLMFSPISNNDYFCHDCRICYSKSGFYLYPDLLGLFLTNERFSENSNYVKVSIEEAERVKRLKAFL